MSQAPRVPASLKSAVLLPALRSLLERGEVASDVLYTAKTRRIIRSSILRDPATGFLRGRAAIRAAAAAGAAVAAFLGINAAESFFARDCPVEVLSHLFGFVSVVEAIRVVRCSKAVYASLVHGAESGSLLGHFLREKQRQFLPARAFFDGPTNESLNCFKGKRLRERFPRAAVITDDALTAAHLGAGPVGQGTWSWSECQLFRGRKCPLPYASSLLNIRCDLPVVESISWDSFQDWASAFRCSSCREVGAALRQCAACGKLLCLACSFCCAIDGVRTADRARTICGFALCGACNEEWSVKDEAPSRDNVLELEFNDETPFLSPPICRVCETAGSFCPSHLDYCILTCEVCADARCMDHINGDDEGDRGFVNCCYKCNFQLCAHDNFRCELEVGRALRYCPNCYDCYCTTCFGATGKCLGCGSSMDAIPIGGYTRRRGRR